MTALGRILAGLAAAGLLPALDSPIVGPRALGMGGTGVSACDDHSAQYYNPAMLGFFAMRDAGGARLASDNNDLGRKRWGAGIDVSAGYAVLGSLTELLDELHAADIRGLAQSGISQPGDLQRLATAAHVLSALDQAGNAVAFDANAGVGMRMGRWALGARVVAQSIAYVSNSDLLNLAMSASGPALATSIVGSGAPSDGQVSLLAANQAQSLYVRFGGDGSLPIDTGSDAWRAVQRVDYALRQAGVGQLAVDRVFTAIDNAAAGNGQATDSNATVVSLTGFGYAEIPISYGFPINEHWAVGATVKGIVGRVYRNDISVFSASASDTATHGFEAYRQTFNVGVDLSVAARTERLQAGLIVRNINRPSFAAPDVNGRSYPDVVMEPQATISEAVIPWDWLTVAIDIDVNAVASLLPGERSQRLGVGCELNPWRVVALRAGAYRNIAADEARTVITAGVGLNLWALRIDAALAATPQRVQVVDWELPEELRASLGVMADF